MVEVIPLAQPAFGVKAVELDQQVELLDLLGGLFRIQLVEGINHLPHHLVFAEVIRGEGKRLLDHGLVRDEVRAVVQVRPPGRGVAEVVLQGPQGLARATPGHVVVPLSQQRQLVGVEGLDLELAGHGQVGAAQVVVDVLEGA